MTTVKNQIARQGKAYKQLYRGASSLLEVSPLPWLERHLLRIVRAYYGYRIKWLEDIAPGYDIPGYDERVKGHMLKAKYDAAKLGHDLGPFERVEDDKGYIAKCLKCELTAYVNDKLIYSLLEDECNVT